MPRIRWVHLTRVAAAAGVAAFAAVTLFAPQDSGLSAFFNVWVYDGLMVLACVIVGSHAYLVQRERVAWTVITVALSCWTFGEIWYAVFKPETYPSMADAGYIAFYVLLYAGVVLLLRSRVRSIADTLWLDGITAAFAAAAIGAAILVDLVLENTEGSTSVVVTNLAYPLGDVLLLSAVFGVFSLTGWRPGPRWLVLGLGILATTTADAVYLFQSSNGTYVEGTWVDILWPTAMLLVASSAWLPDRTREGLEVEGRPLLAVPAVCALVATGILVYDHFTRLNLLAIILASLTLAMVIARLAATFRENRRLFELTQRRPPPIPSPASRTADSSSRISSATETRALAPTLLMLFDLDGFKGYNDSFGHPAGDALLVRLGAKLAAVPGEAAPTGSAATSSVSSRRSETAKLEPLDRPCLRVSLGEGRRLRDRELVRQPFSSRTRRRMPAARCSGGRASLCAEVLAPRRERANDGGAPRGALDREPELEAKRADVAALATDVGAMLGLAATSSKTSSAQPSSTISGSWPCPTRSSTSPGRSTSASGRSSASRRSWESASSAPPPRCAASRASSGRAMRTGMAAAIPTGSSATSRRSRRGSSACAAHMSR